MRSRFVFVLSLAGAMVLGSCSSTDENHGVQVNSAPSANATNSLASSAATTSNTDAMVNGQTVQPQQVDPNTIAASSDPINPPTQGRLEKMRSADTGAGSVDATTLAAQNARPAPDNSTFSTYLTNAGYEVRTFKSNPLILKVEKKIEGNGDQSIKVFLKSGKVVQLPGKAIPVLSSASAESIASAAGLATPPVQAPPAGSTSTKKSRN